MKIQLLLLIIALFAQGCQHGKIIGNWRKVDDNSTFLKTVNPQPGDLIIRSNSTFFIQGDTAINQSSISGWHVGDSLKGAWDQKRKGYIFLWLDPKDSKMVLSYKIITLKKRTLILKPPYIKEGDLQNYIKYSKL